ncbi:MAG: hypothetical protein Q8L48_32355 [Archangium sp.]|nr:hypothetical protein [Archangium sp.]
MNQALRAFAVSAVLGFVASACLSPITRVYDVDAGCNCTSASQCGTGEGCLDCKCGTCTRSSQCLQGQVCVDGTCRGCTGSFECTPPSQCVSALCSPPCTGNDCPNGQVCDLDAGFCAACSAARPCAAGQVCLDGACQPCTANSQCAPGVCQPDAGCGACGPQATCDAGLVCRADGGCDGCTTAAECPAGQACVDSRCQPCVTGNDCPSPLACALGVCDSCNRPGAECPPNRVCLADGGCGVCVDGASCTSNPSQCLSGTAQCQGTLLSCRDSTTPQPPGAMCSGGVCDGDGGCNPCAAGAACGTNLNACLRGTINCGTGMPTCGNSTVAVDAGVVCGANQVCDGVGTCNACVEGVSCSGNPDPCRPGVTSCATGVSRCTDGAPVLDAGTACGPGAVCGPTGSCDVCDAGVACTGNTTTCLRGVLSCASGQAVCVDGTVGVDAGVSCGMGQLCTGAGTCGTCVADAGCTTNLNPCVFGAQSCAAFPVVDCVDTMRLKDAGTTCGTNRVCNTTGTCATCDAGVSCNTNPTACRVGVTSCSTGVLTCINSGTNRPPGTGCDAGVCNSTGACVGCDAGMACSPAVPNPCKVGAIVCTSGAPVCGSTAANLPNGTSCGGLNICASGTCCTPTWVDTTACGGCSASCQSSCTGSKSQSDGCGNVRSMSCIISNNDPCSFCGDTTCDPGENQSNCPQDCGCPGTCDNRRNPSCTNLGNCNAGDTRWETYCPNPNNNCAMEYAGYDCRGCSPCPCW